MQIIINLREKIIRLIKLCIVAIDNVSDLRQ
jgi:hypothetical protein